MGFAIALIIIILILFIRVGVRVRSSGDLSLAVDLGLFRIPVFPKKERDIRLSDYKIKKFRKNLKKEQNKALKKRKKTKKKELTTAEKVEAARRKRDGIKENKRDIRGLIDTVYELVKVFLSRFGKHLRIKVRRLVVTVGSDDAANTAIIYGGICGAVQCFMELLDNCLDVKFPKTSEVRVVPDFTSEKMSAEVDITFSFRIWQVFDMLIRTGAAYLKRLFKST